MTKKGKMSIRGGIGPKSLRLPLALLHLGAFLDLNALLIIDGDVGEQVCPQKERPVSTIPPFILDALIRRPFETAENPRPKRDIFPWREFLREERSFSNVGLQSAIDSLGLGLRITLEPLLSAIGIMADPSAVYDRHVINVGAIRQEHIGSCVPARFTRFRKVPEIGKC